MPESGGITGQIVTSALHAGFDAVGICTAEVLQPERDRYLAWIERGRHADMRWITHEWAIRATDPKTLMPGARSVVCVALSYAGPPAGENRSGGGRIARYANGPDYHQVMGAKLQTVATDVAALGGHSRSFVDTAATMDKALATRAGLGWQGKNTNLLNRSLGSFLFLGGLVTDLALEPTAVPVDGCGSCRACVAACPTGALHGDYTIDAGLCISYLTIEHRGPIPRSLRPLIGDWVFGCDICQDVCPVVTQHQDSAYPDAREKRILRVRQLMHAADDR